MKKLLISFFVVLLFIPVVLTGTAFAQNNIRSSDDIVLPKDQVIEGDYFVSGNNITISGTVNGDAYIAGGNVLIEGTVNGDVLAAGGNINIPGNVTNDVRVAGGQVIVSGSVGRNLTIVGGNATITDSARISGSLAAATGMISVHAPINKSINLAAGNAVIANAINGNVTAGVGNLTLTPNANVSGDINYWSNKQANIQPGASVSGQVKQNIPDQQEIDAAKASAFFASLKTASSIIFIISYLIAGLLLITLYPIYTANIVQTVGEKPFLSFGVGLLVLILFPIIFVLLLITLIGIPIAFLLLAFLCILMFFAPIVVSLTLGQKILEKTAKNRITLGWSLLLGLVIYFILTLIPILGELISVIITIMGIGALLIQQKSLHQKLKDQKIV